MLFDFSPFFIEFSPFTQIHEGKHHLVFKVQKMAAFPLLAALQPKRSFRLLLVRLLQTTETKLLLWQFFDLQ
jgi:hypothetical protein